jgi:hypothetical protein
MIEKYMHGYYIPNISGLAEVVLKELGVSSAVDIQPLKIKTTGVVGYLEKDGGHYTVYIDQSILRADELSDPVINLFIHEIWHIRQMEDRRLRANTENTVAVWEGIHYLMEMPHEKRPWEIEARMMEAKYISQVKELI